MINIYNKKKLIAKLDYIKEDRTTYLQYLDNIDSKNAITISLLNTKKTHKRHYDFIPYFESFLPEGYLFEEFKKHLLKKYGYMDNFLLFSIISKNIDGRIKYSDTNPISKNIELDYLLKNDDFNTFNKLLTMFLDKNAISGVQPKTIATLKDKDTLLCKDYIVKTWGEIYPELAANEYLCLKTLKMANIPIPNIYLSDNRKFLIVEKFISQNSGFEEILTIMDKNTIKKYNGSYEQIAKIIKKYSTNTDNDLRTYFKLVVMNYLMKNGDAHLKNFGLLFNEDFSEIKLAPAYDVVTTTLYIKDDTPALNMFGQKLWHSKEKIIEFGEVYCNLEIKEANDLYLECENALLDGIKLIKEFIINNPDFKITGEKMIQIWEENLINIDFNLIKNNDCDFKQQTLITKNNKNEIVESNSVEDLSSSYDLEI